jgi:hypothetical protein
VPPPNIGAVEIELEDLVLGQAPFQPDREEGLVDLALDGALVAQEQVLGELLGDRGAALADAAGLGVGDEGARGAGDVDAEMLVEAAVLGRQRRLDQHVRKVFQRDRIVVLDAAAADRVAVAIEEGHREVALLQPVLVRGLAEGGNGEREHHDEAAEAQRRGLRQRLDEHPALPPPDIEAVHEGRIALVEFADSLGRGEQRGVDARIEVQEEVPDPRLPVGWRVLDHLELSRLGSTAFKHPAGVAPRRLAGCLRQTQGARFACFWNVAFFLAEQSP